MTKPTTNSSLILWLAIGVMAHIGWGSYPVFSRYLQTVTGLPGLSLLAMGNLTVLVIVSVTLLPKMDRRPFRQPAIWAFGAVVVLRGVTNLFAARYTLAVYVQLVNQMTPFIVAWLSLIVLREALPRYIGRAMIISTIGAFLMLGGQVGQISATRQDWLGIGLAIISSFFLATYMILVRRTSTKQGIPGENLLVVHLVALLTFSLIASLINGDDWGIWQQMQLRDWLVFAAFSLGTLLLANVAQISAIRRLGAPLMSSFMSVRLLAALVVGAFLLGERLDSWSQWLGAGIVLVTITWYLRQQVK